MSLVQHQHRLEDLWTDDLFNHAEVISERLLKEQDSPVNEYELDEEWPLTPAQRQMLEGGLSPWCHISLILPRQSAPDETRIRSTWKQLCSLREYFMAIFIPYSPLTVSGRLLSAHGASHRSGTRPGLPACDIPDFRHQLGH